MEIGKKYTHIADTKLSKTIYTCECVLKSGRFVVSWIDFYGNHHDSLEHVDRKKNYEEYKEPRKVERWVWTLEYDEDNGNKIFQIKCTTREIVTWAGKVVDKQKITWEEGKGFTLNTL